MSEVPGIASAHPRVFLRKPSRRVVIDFLEIQRSFELTYAEVGCTRDASVTGFNCDQYRVRLGHGEAVFAAACEAIRGWCMFPASWTEVIHEHGLRAHETIAVLIKVSGLWWLNSTRIVYVVDHCARQFGFAYGTLPGHVECGEERFLVEWDDEDAVWYDLRAVSRPRHWTTKWGYLFARWQQRRFARDSQQAMIVATR
jgi:uncharacterized protein (UPF0548 family)